VIARGVERRAIFSDDTGRQPRRLAENALTAEDAESAEVARIQRLEGTPTLFTCHRLRIIAWANHNIPSSSAGLCALCGKFSVTAFSTTW